MASSLPPYPQSSMSRSRQSQDEIETTADMLFRSSLSGNSSTASSSNASTLLGYASTPGSLDFASRSPPPTYTTTSRTRERVRQLELERDELRGAIEGERAIAERLKREGGAGEPSAVDAQLRVQQLKHDIRLANAESTKQSTSGLFQSVSSTDLLFLIDTTHSMTGSIEAAKDQVRSIMHDIKLAFLNESKVRVAVVGYKDHGNIEHIQFLDFTDSADRVRFFLNRLRASGGDDLPEDVLGGIQKALNASWKQQTRCIIHICDAPPHGHNLHNPPMLDDMYPIPGTEPHKLTYEPLIKQMVGLKINYALLRIRKYTDRMAFAFLEIYAAASAECKLHPKNMYYKVACGITAGSRSGSKSYKGATAGLVFEEAMLGTTFGSLRHLVVKMVTTSATRTAVRSSALSSRASGMTKMKMSKNLEAIDEDGVSTISKLDTTPPLWRVPEYFNETLVVEGFSPDVIHGARTLHDMMAHDDNIRLSITELTINRRSQPFAEGTLRMAHYACTTASTNRFVVKSFKREGKRLAHVAEDMRCQALCKAFALEFNAMVGQENAIDFIVTTCLKGKSGEGPGHENILSLEPFIRGSYVKYNNNCGYVKEDKRKDRYNQAAQAFSHFTFERSRGRFLVSDIQGVKGNFTDPAIHTLDSERFKLADTNLGAEGFKFFFATHVCNSICQKSLGLESNASMIISGQYKYRESWPTMGRTVCCSNKLCGVIVRLADSKEWDVLPGHRWCDKCWPQLFSYLTKRLCIGPGPHHEYEISTFFYESQGQSVPRKCPEHREEDVAATIPAPVVNASAVSGSWERFKAATRKKSFFGRRS